MTLGLLAGAALGGALCLLVYALVPPRPQLAAQVERWERGRGRRQVTTADGAADFQDRVGSWLAREAARRGITVPKIQADLALLGRSVESWWARKAGLALAGMLIPAVFTGLMTAAGVGVPFTLPAVFAVGLAVVLFWVPDLSVRREAEARRDQLRRSLAAYLDLVAMSLAGGRGVPQALPEAAQIGSGWAFELLEETIGRARYSGTTPWAALADLGERTGVPELVDLGGALTLVADDGAKVRASLTARAESQRQRQLAEAEAAAERADEGIRASHVLLFAGFLVFLGYPAIVNVLGA